MLSEGTVISAMQWAIGDLPAFRRDPLHFLEQVAHEQGEVALFRIGPIPVAVVNDPELALNILTRRPEDFPKGRARPASRVLFGNGLLNCDGEQWVRQRALATEALQESLADAEICAKQVSAEMLDGWSDGTVRDVYDEFFRLSLQISCMLLFARTSGHLQNEMAGALDELTNEFVTIPLSSLLLPAWVPARSNFRIRRSAQVIHRRIGELTSKQPQPGCGGSWLRRVYEEHVPAADRIHQATSLLMAAHETTALAMTWTLWLLARHPAEQERVRDSISRSDTHPLEQSIQEALRLLPPVYAIGREARRELDIGGKKLARGTSVFVSQWLLHRDPRWFHQPLAFRPERWQSGAPVWGSFLPFGAGPRVCPGRTIALQTARIVLSSLLRDYVVVPEGEETEPRASLTLQPSRPVRLRLRKSTI